MGARGARPPLFIKSTITYKVVVYAPAERGRYNPLISPLYLLCLSKYSREGTNIKMTCAVLSILIPTLRDDRLYLQIPLFSPQSTYFPRGVLETVLHGAYEVLFLAERDADMANLWGKTILAS